MTSADFLNSPLHALEASTSISRFRWSKYFNGKMTMREDILHRTAEELGIDSIELFSLIQERRRAKMLTSH
jgi:hypothetical protein